MEEGKQAKSNATTPLTPSIFPNPPSPLLHRYHYYAVAKYLQTLSIFMIHPSKETKLADLSFSSSSSLHSLVNLNHFRLLRVVGKGAFGKVRIVERKDTGLTFALKYIRKDEGMYWPIHSCPSGEYTARTYSIG